MDGGVVVAFVDVELVVQACSGVHGLEVVALHPALTARGIALEGRRPCIGRGRGHRTNIGGRWHSYSTHL